jgi:hypothetical protein
MKIKFSIIILLITSRIFAQSDVRLLDFYYEVESCISKLEYDGKIESITYYDDSTTYEFSMVYQNCYLIDSATIEIKNDTLVLNFGKFEDQGCFCGNAVDIYHFKIKTNHINQVPFVFRLTNKNKLIMDISPSKIPYKEIYPVKYLEINSLIFNYTNKYNGKSGLWLISKDSTEWNYDSLYFYDNNTLITKSPFKYESLFKDSIITYYSDDKIIEKIEKIDGYEIRTSYLKIGSHLLETLTIDPRVPKNGYDKVLLYRKIKNNIIVERCKWYINGKRVIEKNCE